MTIGSWFQLRRELYAVTLDPYTLHEIKRGFLPVGTLVEQPLTTLREADAHKLDAVAVRTRTSEDAVTIGVARVATASLREAVR
jgi:hypothetical protein